MAADLRVDALAKVTGGERFPTDLAVPGMLYGRVVWAPYPHALIRNIDVERARRTPGVVCVLTHRDIPGEKVCGRLIADRPVLCTDKVRYLGDAVALVAATDPAAADRAAEAVCVDYLPLPVVDDPEEAIAAGAARVHEGGNVAAHLVVSRGDVESAWGRAAVVVENTYRTPRQMPAFLETEGGLAYPESDGSIVICCGSQAGNVNRGPIARALALPEEKVRVISSPLGGGFGGKDDITVEIYLALLCRATGRPVRLVLTREESIRFGIKRHPMVIRMKTAATRDGTLLGHRVRTVADTGAYLSLGRSILWLAIEHCTGPYRVPHLHVEGYCVYTNNGVAGACRGFGVNQVAFAVESQMDAIARALAIDPLDLRERNALREGDEGPLGQRLQGGVGIGETIRLVRESELYRNRDRWRADSTWRKKVGVGVACAFKCVGFGLGLPERGVARITVLPGPRFEACVSYEEMGQGSRTAFARIAASALGCPVELVEVVVGDTARVPAGGATSASRGTYLGGGALWAAARDLEGRLRQLACQVLGRGCGREAGSRRGRVSGDGVSWEARSCYDLVLALGDVAWGVSGEGTFDPPKPERGIPGVAGIPHSVFAYMTQAALVEVDTLTGVVRVKETVAAVDAGKVISRAGVVGQVEGGTVMGIGMALTEDVVMEGGYYRTESLADYVVPYALDVPRTVVLLADVPCAVGPLGAKGVGELGAIPITPACTNAICDAVGVRVTELPARPEVIVKLLGERGKPER